MLIILAVKLNNTFLDSTAENSEETICGLVSLLEKGMQLVIDLKFLLQKPRRNRSLRGYYDIFSVLSAFEKETFLSDFIA